MWKRRGCMSERFTSMLAPREWPMPTRGRGMEVRNVLIMCRRSRGWSIQEAKIV